MKKIIVILFLGTDLFGASPILHNENQICHSGHISIRAQRWKAEKENLIQRIETISRLPNDDEKVAASQLGSAIFEAAKTRAIDQIERFTKLRRLSNRQLIEEMKKLPFSPVVRGKLRNAIRSGDAEQLREVTDKVIATYRIDEVRIIDVDSYMNHFSLETTRKAELLAFLDDDDGAEKLLPHILQKLEIEAGLTPFVSQYIRDGWKFSTVFRRQMLAYTALIESKGSPFLETCSSYRIRSNSVRWCANDSTIFIPPMNRRNYFDVVDTIFGSPKRLQNPAFSNFEHEMGHVTDVISQDSRTYRMDMTKVIVPTLFGVSVTEQEGDDFKKFVGGMNSKKRNQCLNDIKRIFEIPKKTDINRVFSYIQERKEHDYTLMKALMTTSGEVWQIHGLLFLNMNGKHVLLVNKIGSDLAKNVGMKQPIRSSHLDCGYETMISKLGCFSFSRNMEIYDPLTRLTCDTTWDKYKKAMIVPGGWSIVKSWWNTVKDWWRTIKG